MSDLVAAVVGTVGVVVVLGLMASGRLLTAALLCIGLLAWLLMIAT